MQVPWNAPTARVLLDRGSRTRAKDCQKREMQRNSCANDRSLAPVLTVRHRHFATKQAWAKRKHRKQRHERERCGNHRRRRQRDTFKPPLRKNKTGNLWRPMAELHKVILSAPALHASTKKSHKIRPLWSPRHQYLTIRHIHASSPHPESRESPLSRPKSIRMPARDLELQARA